MDRSPAKDRAQRVDVAIKVNLKYPDRKTFVERFAKNISRSGLFVRASDPAPVGSRVHFEYRLADDSRVLRGIGIVRWVRRVADVVASHDPPGMGIEFVDVDPHTDQLVTSIVALYGDGEWAPKPTHARAHAPASAGGGEIITLEKIQLDPEEELALDTMLGLPPPTAAQRPSPPPLRGPAPSIVPTPAVQQVQPLQLDLSADTWRLDGNAIAEPADGEVPDALLIRWLGCRWPSPQIAADARRADVAVRAGDDGSVAIATNVGATPIRTLLQNRLMAITAALGAAATRPLEIVVPCTVRPFVATHLEALIAAVGTRKAVIVDDAVNVAGGIVAARSGSRLVITVGEWDARIALIGDTTPPSVRDTTRPYGVSLSAFDDEVVLRAARALVQEFGIDVYDDPSLLQIAQRQARSCRRAQGHGQPWTLAIAGGKVSTLPEERLDAGLALEERLGIACEQLLARCGVAPSDLALAVLAAEDPLWPGVAERLGAALGLTDPMVTIAMASP